MSDRIGKTSYDQFRPERASNGSVQWRMRLLGTASFSCAFAVRWLWSDGDFIGDDAWYYYLAHGFGLESGVQSEHPWFHIANRPLFYVVFHASTWAGLVGFRFFGCCVGALAPLLGFRAARALGASTASAAVTALLLLVQRPHVEYSAYGFPDVLAADFALAACWAAASGIGAWTFWLTLGCVLCKESFVAVAVIMAWLYWQRRDGGAPTDRWVWLTVSMPLLYVATVTSLAFGVADIHMQGWSLTPLSLRHARAMGVGPELWPLMAWLAWRRQARILVLWLGLPAFYVIWTYVLGRGIAPWYVIGPAALSALAIALTLDSVFAECERRQVQQRTIVAVLALVLGVVAPVPLLGLMRIRAKYVSLPQAFPRPRPPLEVERLITRETTDRVLLVGCFWAYRYSHLRAAGKPARAVWWAGNEDSGGVLDAARAADVIVVCRGSADQPLERLLTTDHPQRLLDDDRWLVLARN
jgi:hypothetical protein